MSLITNHWSASGPTRLRDYHVEYAMTKSLPSKTMASLLSAWTPQHVDWYELKDAFEVWKNVDFKTATDYGTYHLNHDPRDQTPNIEIGALCMGGEGVSTSGSWGRSPFTIAHAWMAAGISARVAQVEGLDCYATFNDDAMQNGPLSVLSTHGERALQTPDGAAANLRPAFGYFIFSGDPDCRWDLAARDPSEAHLLATADSAKASAIRVARWIRAQAHLVKAGGITDFWGLNEGIAP